MDPKDQEKNVRQVFVYIIFHPCVSSSKAGVRYLMCIRCELATQRTHTPWSEPLAISVGRRHRIMLPLVEKAPAKWLRSLFEHYFEFSWTMNRSGHATQKQERSRPYFFRRLRSFIACINMFLVSYESAVEIAISFAAICWGHSIRARDLKKVILLWGYLWSPSREDRCTSC